MKMKLTDEEIYVLQKMGNDNWKFINEIDKYRFSMTKRTLIGLQKKGIVESDSGQLSGFKTMWRIKSKTILRELWKL